MYSTYSSVRLACDNERILSTMLISHCNIKVVFRPHMSDLTVKCSTPAMACEKKPSLCPVDSFNRKII